jgi:hypothetical protein
MECEALEDLEKGGGALRTIKDLASGAAGGMAQVLLGRWARSSSFPADGIARVQCVGILNNFMLT